jgi:hypothetical protein
MLFLPLLNLLNAALQSNSDDFVKFQWLWEKGNGVNRASSYHRSNKTYFLYGSTDYPDKLQN